MNINFAQSILAVCMAAAVGMGFAASAGEAKLRFSPELDNILLKDWCKSL